MSYGLRKHDDVYPQTNPELRRQVRQIVQRDGGDFQGDLHEDAGGRFPVRRFADAVACTGAS